MKYWIFLFAIFGTSRTQKEIFECPFENGLYADPYQCDKYHTCYQGQKEEHLCEDGLVFDNIVGRCDYPFVVTCPENATLQKPTNRSIQCPRDNGFFKHEDPELCSIYYWCINGIPNEFYCDGDLHFDVESGSCIWPYLSDRKGCRKHIEILSSGFSCPQDAVQYALNGQRLQHTLFLDPTDCRYFYVCLNGEIPQRHGCPEGLVFSDILLECDFIENYPECLPENTQNISYPEAEVISDDQELA